MHKENQLSLHERREYYTDLLYEQPDALPERYVFMLTAACNLRCPFCYQEHRASLNRLRGQDWIAFAAQLPDYARVTLVGGEPLLYPDFAEVAAYVGQKYQVNCITNGLLLTASITDHLLSLPGFRVLSVSIDTVGNANRGYTAAQWDTLVEQLTYFTQKKAALGRDDVVLDIKSVLYGGNTAQLLELQTFLTETLHCDTNSYSFLCGSSLQCNTRAFGFEELLIPTSAETLPNFSETVATLEVIRQRCQERSHKTFVVPRYVPFDSPLPLAALQPYVNTPEHNAAHYQACKYPWSNLMIAPDGQVFPCLSVPVGHISEPLPAIVQGEAMTRFRALIREHGTLPACNRCVWLKLNAPLTLVEHP